SRCGKALPDATWPERAMSRCGPSGRSPRAPRSVSCSGDGDSNPNEEATMTIAARVSYLRIALIIVGVSFIGGIYLFTKIWPSGWSWGTGHSHYLPMILGVYATLGIFLLLASRDPLANRSLIWFTVWSSVVHAAVMAWSSIVDPAERGHLVGDV